MKAKDMPPQPGDDDPVNPERPDITWGHLFGRKKLEGPMRQFLVTWRSTVLFVRAADPKAAVKLFGSHVGPNLSEGKKTVDPVIKVSVMEIADDGTTGVKTAKWTDGDLDFFVTVKRVGKKLKGITVKPDEEANTYATSRTDMSDWGDDPDD